MNGQPIRPGTWLYWLAGVMAVAAVVVLVLGVVNVFGAVTKMGEGLQQVVVPGTATLALDEPGTYTIYHEHHSAVGGRTFSNPGGLSGLVCTVTEKETGRSLSLSGASLRETYSLGSRQGASVWQFTIDKAGPYEVSARYEEGAAGPEVVLAVGRPMLKGLPSKLLAMGGGICAFFVLGGGAVAILLVTFFKRRSAKSRLMQPPSPTP